MIDTLRVLLVDDDEDDYLLTRALLLDITEKRFVLDWVPTFERALDAMQRANHDVYLVDYRLGTHDGLELLSKFAPSKVPIIILTGDENPAVDLKAMQLGAMDYLVKSHINAPLLERSIRHSIARKKTEEQLREAQEQLEQRVAERTAELTRVNDELDLSAKRSAFLADASRILASSLDFNTTLKNMTRVGTSAFPDAWCLIDIVNNERVERLEIAHADPAMNAHARKYSHGSQNLDADVVVARVIRTGHPETGRVNKSLLAEAAIDFDLKGYLTVPLISRGQTLGALSFVSSHGDGYSESDVRYAELLADRAAVALDNSRLYTELQKSDRLKDEFLATMSHELRTPLTPILGWSRMLKNGTVGSDHLHQAIDVIVRNAELEAKLVEDILDASRIVSGKLKLEFQMIDVGDILKLLVQSWKPVADAKHITFCSDFKSMPLIWGNPQRLQQIFANLLSNAFKFTPPGGRITLGADSTDLYVQVKITDTGIGIKPDFLPHVFERFRQADGSTTRKHGGLGLGLAIVRHLVEMHGGQVKVESEGEGKGATFTVNLPVPATSPARFRLHETSHT